MTSKTSAPITVSIPVCGKPLPGKSILMVSASSTCDPSSQASSWTLCGTAAVQASKWPGSLRSVGNEFRELPSTGKPLSAAMLVEQGAEFRAGFTGGLASNKIGFLDFWHWATSSELSGFVLTWY